MQQEQAIYVTNLGGIVKTQFCKDCSKTQITK